MVTHLTCNEKIRGSNPRAGFIGYILRLVSIKYTLGTDFWHWWYTWYSLVAWGKILRVHGGKKIRIMVNFSHICQPAGEPRHGINGRASIWHFIVVVTASKTKLTNRWCVTCAVLKWLPSRLALKWKYNMVSCHGNMWGQGVLVGHKLSLCWEVQNLKNQLAWVKFSFLDRC